ncbi:MAG TPA: multicopper oxidase domain-containing protein [Acidimicrobiia bacterium]|nr:multicopper oxidase domain-containing protein [Acidimicrobiia bacterium]
MVHKPKSYAIKYIAVFVLLTSLVLAGCSSDSDKDETSHGSKSSGKGAEIDFSEKPSKDFKARDPKLAPAPTETVHEITLIANEKVVEVSPGVTQEMWVFDDNAPAPTLRGKIGDTFKVTIKNEGKITHSMDFHSSYAAWNKKMIAIPPGESHLYEFVAEKAGIFMYHCGTSPALHHVGNGMWGSIVIDPPDLADVDHEFVFNQGELYTGPEGKPGDLDKMLADEWDAIVFNGYVNQYLHRPIRVEANERIRVWVLDGGPSENSSFHVIGTIFDTVYKEGNYTLRPGAGGSQALDLQPAQGGFVEFTFKEEGLYPFVTHKFSNASKGAMGIFQAGEAADTEVSH